MDAKLYLCATPIGNLEDITLRVSRVLAEVDCIYCEDTRRTAKLLNALDLSKPLISCHTHNEQQRAQQIAQKLREGVAVAYVSDAGMPGISDPGEKLIAECIRENLPFEVLPGASAALTALVLSGLPSQDACFAGFLPRTGKARRERIARLGAHHGTLILYESPLRVAGTLSELLQSWGDRPACLVRELTKVYEQAVRGTLASLAERYVDAPPKGECVLLIGGRTEQTLQQDPETLLSALLEQGVSAKDAAKQVSALTDIPRNQAYAMALELGRKE